MKTYQQAATCLEQTVHGPSDHLQAVNASCTAHPGHNVLLSDADACGPSEAHWDKVSPSFLMQASSLILTLLSLCLSSLQQPKGSYQQPTQASEAVMFGPF